MFVWKRSQPAALQSSCPKNRHGHVLRPLLLLTSLHQTPSRVEEAATTSRRRAHGAKRQVPWRAPDAPTPTAASTECRTYIFFVPHKHKGTMKMHVCLEDDHQIVQYLTLIRLNREGTWNTTAASYPVCFRRFFLGIARCVGVSCGRSRRKTRTNFLQIGLQLCNLRAQTVLHSALLPADSNSRLKQNVHRREQDPLLTDLCEILFQIIFSCLMTPNTDLFRNILFFKTLGKSKAAKAIKPGNPAHLVIQLRFDLQVSKPSTTSQQKPQTWSIQQKS